MASALSSVAGKRVLIVEDELMIRMLLQDMLADLGCKLPGEGGRIDEALTLAKQSEFDVAILDVNLNGQPISPVVDILIEGGLPFVFAPGYGQPGGPGAIPAIGGPKIRVAPAILALLDLQPFLAAAALRRHGNALDFVGRAIGKV